MGSMEGVEDIIRPHEEKIYVSVRLRPLNEKEILKNDVSDWECINDNTVIYKNVNLSASERSMYPTAYTFDRVFRCDCSTRQVYEEGAKEVALSVVSGINSSVFAYGQTSSGKTYTMTGITEYTIADIYDYIHKHKEREFLLKFSAIEIYNESVRDLLSADSSPLRLLDDPERGTIVEKLTEEIVKDWNHVMDLLSICEAQRQIGETFLNETSSRSHQIIRLTIESSAREFLRKDSSSTLAASVNFVDLAGSERASQALSAGTRLKEGCHINRSLLTLGTVIRKLSKGRNGHIPFRDSKLTRILQTSLGGNARTAIICTMSPARSHVEQSRNTLLFASCAKEVTTSAQVNVVMSDKALVKHLQRELARLESELKSPMSNIIPSDYAAVLKEKDLQIEKLEKEVKDLILQRDIAQSQVKDLFQLLGDDGGSLIRVGVGNYPNLRVRRSPDSGHLIPEMAISADPNSFDSDVRTFSDGHSRSSSEDHFAHVPDIEESFLNGNLPPRLLVSVSNFSETDSCQGWEEADKLSNMASEDQCKEVRCIETEEFTTKGATEYNSLSPAENNFPTVMMVENWVKPNEGLASPPPGKNTTSVSPRSEEYREMESLSVKNAPESMSRSMTGDGESQCPALEEERELSCIHSSDVPFPTKLSSPLEFTKDSSGSESLKLTKSRSCKASLMENRSPPLFENPERNEHTPASDSDRDFIRRPEGFHWKLSPLNYDFDAHRSPGKDSQTTPLQTGLDKLEDCKTSLAVEDDMTINKCITEMKEMVDLHNGLQDCKSPVKETEAKSIQTVKNVKDVGLDPIEDDVKHLSNWPTEFKRLQKEIIELWHACNVSLVHRTYFFLLFQGDSTDAIYMEVELRRLSFLRDTFSRGDKTMVNGRTLTLASSMKALRHERRMLSKQMLKKLSEQERESLFLKWGIAINSKLRRLQLAHRLWTNAEDMNHIADSAFLVAKLVGLIEPGQAPKEMFGLNFAPRTTTRSYSFKRSLISLL